VHIGAYRCSHTYSEIENRLGISERLEVVDCYKGNVKGGGLSYDLGHHVAPFMHMQGELINHIFRRALPRTVRAESTRSNLPLV